MSIATIIYLKIKKEESRYGKQNNGYMNFLVPNNNNVFDRFNRCEWKH